MIQLHERPFLNPRHITAADFQLSQNLALHPLFHTLSKLLRKKSESFEENLFEYELFSGFWDNY